MILLLLTSICCAQTAQPITANINHGTYRFDTGFEITQHDYRSGPATIFDGSLAAAYYFMPSSSSYELIDEGAFSAAGVIGNEQVNGMNFSYCTTESQVDCELRFYADNIYSSGPSGWIDQTNRGEACVYGLAGLPGIYPGMLSCWSIAIDLSGGFECTLPQEQVVGSAESFGWSTIWLTQTASTGLFLPTPAGPHGYGTRPSFELFDLSQPYGSEYQGVLAMPSGNFSMKLYGTVHDTQAYYSVAPLANDTVRFNAISEIRAGSTASWAVENANAGSTYGMLVSSQIADLPIVANGTASLLVNHGLFLTNPIHLGSTGSLSVTLPAVLPPVFFTQSVELNGVLAPSNVIATSNGLVHYN
ncbi:MAG: hypothetical protein OSB63_04625 [Planctomycetota bacterium]|nr:hypothetical protein [Planctomycetota bacterium]